MISILAPSKTMDFSPLDIGSLKTETPLFQSDAEQIVAIIRQAKDLQKLMHISPALATSVAQKYGVWGKSVKPAIYTYVGDVYKGFYAKTLSPSDVVWAEQHLMIMSGLYGILRPLDLVSGYRLEMKARLAVGKSKDIYEFWGDKLARVADEKSDGVICVLSSDEYARPVTRFATSQIVTPTFFDTKPGGVIGTVPIYSKMMRGVMARWVIDNRVNDPIDLQAFTGQGYAYSSALSKKNQPAFYRKTPVPIAYIK